MPAIAVPVPTRIVAAVEALAAVDVDGVNTPSWNERERLRLSLQAEANLHGSSGFPEVARAIALAAADAEHRAYPQYVGHWDNWGVAVATRRVKTKMGVALEPGDVVLHKQEPSVGGVPGRHTVYSLRNGIDTAVEGYVAKALVIA